ncbi:2-oxodicarboxylate carrier 2 [Thecamonas trahens ATCC 50062]|uniref:2-oxodicarboxylate carrier 2 n=1 Tax=Thecamonas trahens ATCC 50062 TaxID=461836 RepID=A0A0L0D607_THETB|nr:2-oxodicarboxylate carrier 2 [Thecamonas trahens ATCC 50062]KNC47615.1 2-oxodicarboxylate carrier 2 [Thecamonas trahens ATCC 50062]|eukprot:XP_013759540.1 2-oxodicarboxylate carrier 2 [Thecamonas trahens ATCC 50062]
MIKTRFQISTTPNPSVMEALVSIVRNEGFLRLYRGMLPEMAGMVPKSSAMYSTYELVRREGERRNGGMSVAVASAAGLASGVAEAAAVHLFQIPKVRLQAKAYNNKYSGTLDCLRQMLRDEPLSAFGRGLGPTLWRNMVWNTVYFGLMHHIKSLLPATESRLGSGVQTLGAGFVAGIVATCFNAPFDAVKSRFQAEVVVPGQAPKYTSTLPSLVTIYREEGLSACYKGFAPKAIRMGIGGAVCMATFELVCFLLHADAAQAADEPLDG